MMRDPEVLWYEVLPRQHAANSQYTKHAEFNLMSVRVPWNAGVTQTDYEPIALSVSDHEGLVGNLAVSGNPLQAIT